ncbi:unnamed protein product [Brugia timori]|uniref:Uncharacterized protein n=1 Tax=Brugia timori TaxID=42155 RepID=A0A0R3Q541_9BILA|nr:unnamed protein product [Brugia timori]
MFDAIKEVIGEINLKLNAVNDELNARMSCNTEDSKPSHLQAINRASMIVSIIIRHSLSISR